MNKSELLQALRESGERAASELSALPPAKFDEGRYENGWNARQILAHIASIEWTYPRLIDMARASARKRSRQAERRSARSTLSAILRSSSGSNAA